MSVQKKVRTETQSVEVNVSQGEYLQYLLSSASNMVRFTLMDATTKEIILSERVPATLQQPTTYARLWPVVGDRPQRESSLILGMDFAQPALCYRFQVLLRRQDSTWNPVIDMDFESHAGGEAYLFTFEVRAT